MSSARLRVLVGGLSLLAATAAQAGSLAARRMAVLVGANEAAPGRKTLRYSYDDVKSVAAVLRDLGGFTADNVVELFDPSPTAVLAVLDRRLAALAQAGEESVVLFYYSGHADAQNLFPNGKPLRLSEIRTRLERAGPSVRLGLVDACRGGGWTAVKGLTPARVFEIEMPMELASEGSAFIASSSGLEDAHESEALGGSFFTHHWVAALRGAGDRDQDGRITISEAFDYAKEMTIRDTALVADTPQHPSFQYNLRGRRDLSLAVLDREKTLLALEQTEGPLQLVDLRSGLIILEVPAGARQMRLAVPPGKYLVRRRAGERTLARVVVVVPGTVTPVSEANLEVMAMTDPAAKGLGDDIVTSVPLPESVQAPPAEPSLAVLPLSSEDLSGAALAALDDLLVVAMDRQGPYKVISPQEIVTTLGSGSRREALRCAETKCAVEIGGALGTRFLLFGSAQRLGGNLYVTLSLMDTAKQEVLRRAQTSIADNERGYEQAIVSAVGELLLSPVLAGASPAGAAAQGATTPSATTPTPPAAVWRARLLLGGLAAIAVGGVVLGYVLTRGDTAAKPSRQPDLVNVTLETLP